MEGKKAGTARGVEESEGGGRKRRNKGNTEREE